MPRHPRAYESCLQAGLAFCCTECHALYNTSCNRDFWAHSRPVYQILIETGFNQGLLSGSGCLQAGLAFSSTECHALYNTSCNREFRAHKRPVYQLLSDTGFNKGLL